MAVPPGRFYNMWSEQGLVPPWITVPPSVVIPFGTFDAILENDINTGVMSSLARLVGFTDPDPLDTVLLADIRATVLGLRAPEEFVETLQQAFKTEGLHCHSRSMISHCLPSTERLCNQSFKFINSKSRTLWLNVSAYKPGLRRYSLAG